MIKFGKPLGEIIALKDEFIRENDSHLKRELDNLEHYKRQPHRTTCKNCDEPIDGVSFTKLGVDYSICGVCGHLNGVFDDTEEYCNLIYADDSGKDYAREYLESEKEEFQSRVTNIYSPKANFLKEGLREVNTSPGDLKCLDVGAGAGFFVQAMLENGFSHTSGIEVSGTMVDMGRNIIPGLPLEKIGLNDIYQRLKTTDAGLVSMIGVLEHLQKPRLALQLMKENPSVKYFYFSVPLYSISLFFEMVSPQVKQRVTGFAHTHLYTESSIQHFCDEFGFRRLSEWWFGMDALDLYRNISVRLMKEEGVRGMIPHWHRHMAPVLDDIQLALDKRRLSDEVHMLLDVS